MGLLQLSSDGITWSARRITDDDWTLNACSIHGPALSIDQEGRYHITWFTQGVKRQGLSYAYSDDQGKRFSSSMPFCDNKRLAEHPDVLALEGRVVLVWREFDGKKTRIMAMQSRDRGDTWVAAGAIADSDSESDHPFVITDGKTPFLSWNTLDHGYRLVPIK